MVTGVQTWLFRSGFANVYIVTGNLEVGALAFLQPPDAATRQKLGLPASG